MRGGFNPSAIEMPRNEALDGELVPRRSERQQERGRRAEIEVSNRHMRDISADSIAELAAAVGQDGQPLVYDRGTLVRAKTDPRGRVSVEHLTVPALKGILDRLIDYVSTGEKGPKPARPPQDVCRDILVMSDQDFPPLNGIARAPIFLQNGTLLSQSGYDADSGILAAFDGLASVRTDIPIDEARSLICDELLGDFPFTDYTGRTLACGAMMQPFVRQLIDGPTPLYLLDAPARGTGKGLLAEVITIVATGLPVAPMALTQSHDELEKRITAALLGDIGTILLDNVTRLYAAPLAAVLTADFGENYHPFRF